MRNRLKQKGYTLIELGICVFGVLAIAAVVTVVCIAGHFIAKAW